MAKRTRRLSLQMRVGLTFVALVGVLLVGLGDLWVHSTRRVIALQVQAAGDVTEQWLRVISSELLARASATQRAQEITRIYALGAIRDNRLEVIDRAQDWVYRAPDAHRPQDATVPRWFATLVEPRVESWRTTAGQLTFIVAPDPAPATERAWVELRAMAGRALVILVASLLLTYWALRHSLQPLEVVVRALDRTGEGSFDMRLPVLPVPELDRLARSFNGMIDGLHRAVDENVRLHSEQVIATRLQGALEAERRGIARELHDELAQCITAVRAIAAAIALRAQGDVAAAEQARRIIAVSGQMQDGVRAILQQLRHVPRQQAVDDLLRRDLEAWRRDNPGVTLRWDLAGGPDPLDPLDSELAHALRRIAQEGLTNVARHAGATRVDVVLRRLSDGRLEFVVADDGRGLKDAAERGGMGLIGMRERVHSLGGEFSIDAAAGRGTRLRVRLPGTAPEDLKGCEDENAPGRTSHCAGR